MDSALLTDSRMPDPRVPMPEPRRDVTSLTGPEFRNGSCSLLLLGRYGGRVTGGFDRICGQSVWLTR